MSALAQRYVQVPDGRGGYRHELRAVADVPARGRRRRPIAPDPIKASADSAAQTLRQYIEQAERVMVEIAEMQADLADIFSEAKGQGFDVATMKAIIGRRKREKHVLDEADALLETYMISLGLK